MSSLMSYLQSYSWTEALPYFFILFIAWLFYTLIIKPLSHPLVRQVSDHLKTELMPKVICTRMHSPHLKSDRCHSSLGHLKNIVDDRLRPPHEKGPAPKKIIFFILKKTAKKRFIDYYGPLAVDNSTSLVLTKFSFDPQHLYRSL
jgi:hypothetical protein